ncbi:MAG: hypothetical protein JWM47_361 [Acidimicrobiales bacterium]|nr:hypothetical protein [Acidimicrobiales bacterium]
MLLTVAVSACGMARPDPARTVTDEGAAGAEVAGPLVGRVIADGRPGWQGAGETMPSGVGEAVDWTGSELVLAGYSSATYSGDANVAVYSPETGDWMMLPGPFRGEQTTGVALGHDGVGGLYAVAGRCGPILGGDDTLRPGQCPYGVRLVERFADGDWTSVPLPTSAQNRDGKTGDATEFVGAQVDDALFSINHRLMRVSPTRVRSVPAPASGQEAFCSLPGGESLLATTATIHGDPLALKIQLKALGADAWAPVALDPGLVSAAEERSASGDVVIPRCSTDGMVLFIRTPPRVVAFRLVIGGDPPTWSRCDLPPRQIGSFAVAAEGPELLVSGIDVAQLGTTALTRCTARKREGTALPPLPVNPPHLLLHSKLGNALVSRNPDGDTVTITAIDP